MRQEGHFIIRYRIFNICGAQAQAGPPSVPILAECYGGAFEIFSTKTFPGLPASTDLTKVSNTPPRSVSLRLQMREELNLDATTLQRLSLSGFRVNSRHRERRTRKKPAHVHNHSSESPTGSVPRGSSAGILVQGPSRALCRTPPRKAYHPGSLPSLSPQFAPSFSAGGFAYGMPLPQPVGLFASDADSARNALAEWQRREMRGDLAGSSRDGPSPSGTDESGSGRSLW